MEVKKLFLIVGMLGMLSVSAQQNVKSANADARQLKKQSVAKRSTS